MVSISSVVAVTPAGPWEPETRRASFRGTGWGLFGIAIRNILLTIITLGIYYFWGKNRTRQYLIGQSEFEGDRFAWHGTGRELFIGGLKLLGFVLLLIALFVVVGLVLEGPVREFITSLLTYSIYLVLVPVVGVGARRYRFSRLSWRGIRFSFRGRFGTFIKIYALGGLLSALTLGLYFPYFQARARQFATEHTYFGATPFRFDGRGGALFPRFFLMVAGIGVVMVVVGFRVFGLLFREFVRTGGQFESTLFAPDFVVPLLIGTAVIVVLYFWYAAFRYRYFWEHTAFSTARFRSTATAWRLFVLTATNLLLLVITLGLAFPWVTVRNVHFAFSQVTLQGPLDLTTIVQDAQAAGVTGESAADLFGLDVFGLDLPI